MSEESFYIEWKDPVDNTLKYACLSSETGLYWSESTDDHGILDGSFLDTEYTIDDTISQVAEQLKLHKGIQFNRKYCVKHPTEHKWLKVEKKVNGQRDEQGKPIRVYTATWSHKFKSVSVISSITGRPQGNPGLQNKEYIKDVTEKSKISRKKRVESIEKAAKRLNFNPAEALIAWAMGDETKLNTKQPITNTQRLKSVELLASYLWAKPKPVDPNAVRDRANSGPQINVILPADGSEIEGNVLTHDSEKSLEEYLKRQTSRVFEEYEMEDSNVGNYNYSKAVFELPDEE